MGRDAAGCGPFRSTSPYPFNKGYGLVFWIIGDRGDAEDEHHLGMASTSSHTFQELGDFGFQRASVFGEFVSGSQKLFGGRCRMA